MSSTRRGKKSDPEVDRKYTPDALAVALVTLLQPDHSDIYNVLEPSVGAGAFVRAIRGWDGFGHYSRITAIDIDPAAEGMTLADKFLCQDFLAGHDLFDQRPPALIIGNPPYAQAELHIRKALEIVATGGTVAFLLRLNFLGSRERNEPEWSIKKGHPIPFWKQHPPSRVIVLTPRPSFTNGGTDSCEYAFMIWNGTALKGIEWLAWK